ncbi:MAG: hypothetical protein WD768_06150, partial [Phycisphaeraceae bacterium]
MNQPQHSDAGPEGRAGIDTDPWLDALLDDALSSDRIGVPAGLTDRIVAATAHQLPGRRGVLAYLGFSSATARIAATFLLIASLGITFFVVSKSNQNRRAEEFARADAHAKQLRDQAALARFQQLEDDLRRFAHNSPVANDPLMLVNAPIDQSLDQVKARLNSDLHTAVESWDLLTDSLMDELALLDTESNG